MAQTKMLLAQLNDPTFDAAFIVRTAKTLTASHAQLTAAKAQLDAAAAQLSSGSAQYSAGRAQYNQGKKEWEESGPKLEKARKELIAAKLELADGKTTLENGRQQLSDGKRDLAVAAATIADGEKDYKQGLIDWDEAQIELIDARKKLDDGKIEYNDGVKELADAKIELRDETAKAQKKLTDAKIELDDGEKEYADGVIEYHDGKAEAEEKIGDAKKKLNDARRKIADMEDCDWYVLGRKTNAGFVSYQSDAQRIGNLAAVFPIIFFLVAALVCLTTMTRMVEEQRVQIGGMKALGYSKQAIAFKYVGYGFTASLIGGLCGLALGLTIIPTIIFNAWRTLYTLPDMVFAPALGLSVVSVSAAVVTITGAALAASIAALAAVPAQLMRPKAPAIGKRVLLERITPLWKRLNFSLKVAVRNLFRYKKRFWMTVIGIGGCTALIIVGFGLRDSISGVVPKQFEELYHYESQVGMVDDATPEEQADLLKALEKDPHIEAYLPHYQKNVTVETDKKSVDATLMAFDDPAAVGDFITLRDRLSHEPVTLGTTGAVLTEKTASLLHVALGDTFTLDDGDHRYTLTVSGITENYVLHYIYVEKGYYETLTGEDCTTNSVLCRHVQGTKADEDELARRMMSLSGVTAVSSTDTIKQSFADSISSVDYAVLIIIISAAALAFVVLYNLTNINITERQRELATLKVLGFYDGELSAYVYRENIFLTIFGILMGLIMGFFLHQYLILTVEIDILMFARKVSPMSYLFAILLTAFFSLVVNLAAHQKLKKIDMVESLKTVE
ncbi:MAG: FtsX-like permease family protein [Oscillospiraceae bacterium]